jgi:hypothetical protein
MAARPNNLAAPAAVPDPMSYEAEVGIEESSAAPNEGIE